MIREPSAEDADFSVQSIVAGVVVVGASCGGAGWRNAGAAVAARAELYRAVGPRGGKGGRIGKCGDVDLARGIERGMGRRGTCRWERNYLSKEQNFSRRRKILGYFEETARN
jgi:hypothetical protein